MRQYKIGVVRDKKVSTSTFLDYLKHHLRSIETIDLNPHMDDIPKHIGGLDILLLPEISDDRCYYFHPLMQHREIITHESHDKGLTILGVCAGANALAEQVIFHHPDGSITKEKGLGITLGESFGPVDQNKAPETDHENYDFDGMRALKVQLPNFATASFSRSARFSYGDGPGFTPYAGEKIHSLAQHTNPNGDTRDMLFYKHYGRGLVVSFGVLPYIGTRHMAGGDTVPSEHRQEYENLRQGIKPYEAERIRIMMTITMLIKSHIQNLAPTRTPVLQPTS